MVYAFKGMVPVIDPSSYVHPQATVIGHVTIGKNCYVGPGAVLRGDWGRILLEDGCNAVSYTHLRAHETREDLVCRLLLEKKKKT